MASLNPENGRWRIQFTAPDGSRKTIRLGKIQKKDAEAFKYRVEVLLDAKMAGVAVDRDTAGWVGGLSDSMRDRIERAELIEPREKVASYTLAKWVRDYILGRTDIKPNSLRNMKQAETDLIVFLGDKKMLDAVTPGDAEEFRRFLKQRGLAEATVRRRCKRCKQFFAAAIKKRLFIENPFDEIPTADRVNTARKYFVPRNDIYQVINACSDAEWRLIFALARFAGLRIPSELLPLTWNDINWSENKILIHSPKTEHIEGKATRLIPLFPELLPYLQDVYDLASPGQKFLITRYRHKGVNLGTQAHRIIISAGLKPWPKTFHNLRASCETELVEEFSIHVVTAWLGNSPEVAKKHYLQVTEEHYQRAVEKATQNPTYFPTQHTSERPRNQSQQAQDWDSQPIDIAGTCDRKEKRCGSLRTAPHTPTGIRTPVSRMRT